MGFWRNRIGSGGIGGIVKKYTFRTDITFTVEVQDDKDLESAYFTVGSLLPDNTVILSIQGWPSKIGYSPTELDDIEKGTAEIEARIDKLEIQYARDGILAEKKQQRRDRR